MKIAIGSDHGGVELKETLKAHLENKGYEVVLFGATSAQTPFDYPDVALEVATAVKENVFENAILICGTGIGIGMAANKVPGIRAATCADYFSAKYTKIHNNSQIICLGARVVGPGKAIEMVDVFLESEYEGGRHDLRIQKIHDIEKRFK